MSRTSEAAFEAVIEAHLLAHGWARCPGGRPRCRTMRPS